MILGGQHELLFFLHSRHLDMDISGYGTESRTTKVEARLEDCVALHIGNSEYWHEASFSPLARARAREREMMSGFFPLSLLHVLS